MFISRGVIQTPRLLKSQLPASRALQPSQTKTLTTRTFQQQFNLSFRPITQIRTLTMISASKYAAVHQSPKGPGDARPTALQIISDNDLTGKLTGKTILITGCSSGIGITTAAALKTTGAKLFLTARNLPKARKALGSILEDGKAELLELDLNSLSSVRKSAEEFKSRSDRLDVLICNAGIMALPELEKTADGFESQFGVNHLAHFLLFNLLKPMLLASQTKEFNSRVVTVSSVGHRTCGVFFDDYNFEKPENAYSPWKAYGQSKTANIYMANEIERRYGSSGLHANSLMPGGIATGLQDYVPEETRKGWFADNPIVKSLEQGAATTVLAAVGRDWEGVGGKYLENCQEVEEVGPERTAQSAGWAKHAFDEEKEKRLWKESLIMVGLRDDE